MHMTLQTFAILIVVGRADADALLWLIGPAPPRIRSVAFCRDMNIAKRVTVDAVANLW